MKEVNLKDLEVEIAKYQAAQMIIDSWEPTEAEKKLAKQIEEYFEALEEKK